ncbi:MAG TPA: Fe-S cluster assembly ATPase SufC [bacterium]|nr:Fe-S cluster assembly ATPase SufC [bacterium]
MLSCTNLSVFIEEKKIISNLSLAIPPGSVHTIMGPNGSGKSTLAHTIAGNTLYRITSGDILFREKSITQLPPHQRARLGIFVSFQQPPTIPGLKVFSLLKEAYRALHPNDDIETEQFQKQVEECLALLRMDRSFLYRSCNEGFSGGERKRFELLQLLVLKPKFIILDEIDSGLDVDALKLVARVVNMLRAQDDQRSFLIITHYQRIFAHLNPDAVHVLCDGRIVDSGDASLLHQVDQKGYDAYQQSSP